MKFTYFAIILLIITVSLPISAQSAKNRQFGFGLVLGEPTGAAFKFRTGSNNAIAVNAGVSYFGSPRVGVDYLWHFNAFRSSDFDLYAGAGGVLGFGESRGFWYKKELNKFYNRSEGVGIAARGVIGVDAYLPNTPVDIFLEVGLLLGLAPNSGAAMDGAIGIRFYP